VTSTSADKSNAGMPGLLSPSSVPEPPPSSIQQRPYSRTSAISSVIDRDDTELPVRSKSLSVSSNVNTLASSKGSAAAEAREQQRAVRTLPPWVQSVEEDDDTLDPSRYLLPHTPSRIRPASHNHMPTPKSNAVAGRIYDHVREGTPVTISSPISENATKWQQFAQASAFGRPSSSRGGRIVDEKWMQDNLPDLEAPWNPIDEDEHLEDDAGFWLLNPSRRKLRMRRLHRIAMNNPIVPLVVRLTVLTFSALALGLASSIFHKAGRTNCSRGSSTWLAVIVDVVAIIYTMYITWDEYTSKPLGLRSHRSKMRLIFLDLIFVVFDSANLSLAFEALTDDQWACRDAQSIGNGVCELNHDICVRQKALTATLLIALLAWLVTFGISTLRVVEKAISR